MIAILMAGRRAAFAPDVPIDGVIENGVPLHRYAPVRDKGDFVLALGRICPEKGLLIDRAIERAVDDGAFEFDFLRGQEPYKYEWGAVDRPAHAARVALTGRRSS